MLQNIKSAFSNIAAQGRNANIAEKLSSFGRNGAAGLAGGAGSVFFGTMGKVWEKNPLVATGVAMGTNALSVAAGKNDKVAQATAIAWPAVLLGASQLNKRFAKEATPKTPKALETVKKFAETALKTARNNPVPTAFAAGIAAISLGSYMVQPADKKK